MWAIIVYDLIQLLKGEQRINAVLKQKQLSEVFYKKAVLNNFVTFTGKHLCWSLFSIKFPAWKPEILLKRDSNTDTTAQKGFPLRISSVNVNKSAVSCDLVTFTEKIINGKLNFLCSLLSCQNYKVLKNIYFAEYLQTAASITSTNWIKNPYLNDPSEESICYWILKVIFSEQVLAMTCNTKNWSSSLKTYIWQ